MRRLQACAALAAAAIVAAGSSAAAAESSLHFSCGGTSAGPTVILEAGAFGTSADWSLVQDALQVDGRVCAYDRAGLGRSPPRPGVQRDASTIAGELREALDAATELDPVILVGHSNGALYIQTFAALWSERVAGLVYVDGVHDGVLERPELLQVVRREAAWASVAPPASTLGVMRLMAPSAVSAIGLVGSAAKDKRQAFSSLRHARTGRDEALQIEPSLRRLRELTPPPASVPVAAVVAGAAESGRGAAWRAVQVTALGSARRVWVIDAPGASHVDPLGRYRSYTVAAVNWIRDEARRTAED